MSIEIEATINDSPEEGWIAKCRPEPGHIHCATCACPVEEKILVEHPLPADLDENLVYEELDGDQRLGWLAATRLRMNLKEYPQPHQNTA